jgi:hypothetical protein
MTTRRRLLQGTLSAVGFSAVQLWAAKGEFWNEKQPDAWSTGEIERLLSRSPWAKEAELEFEMGGDGPGGGGFPGGPGGGGPPGGGGFPGGGPPGGGGPPAGGPPGGFPGGGPGQMKAVVRWESAKPIREARMAQAPAEFAKYYVIGLAGFPMRMGPEGGPGEDQGGRGNRTDRRRPEAGQMKANLEQATQLQIRNREILRPEKVMETEDGLRFLFSRDDHPIKRDDRDVTFQTKLGFLSLKVKFSLKDMVYRGQLEL